MMLSQTSPQVHAHLASTTQSWVSTRFDAAHATLWIGMEAPTGRALNFSPDLLRQLQGLIEQVDDSGLRWPSGDDELPVHYVVLRSEHPEYFNLGGDLNHFLQCIRRHDSAALRRYSMQCLDMIHRWGTSLSRDTTTIALVQGRALGGGFEAALAADYIIAEERAECGLPEILFGLFPCSGAMSLLARRVGLATAERMMRSGKIYSAQELLDMGVIDEICPSGRGEAAVREFIDEHARRRKARMAMQRARARLMPLDYAELATVVDEWVQTAMELEADEIRVLETLVRMQRADFAH